MHLHNNSIHRNLYQNRFINECARKKKAKNKSFPVSELFGWCIRTYVLNKYKFYMCRTECLFHTVLKYFCISKVTLWQFLSFNRLLYNKVIVSSFLSYKDFNINLKKRKKSCKPKNYIKQGQKVVHKNIS